ncbi:hypothetical protein ACMGDM_18725 [Sphingomonas sp. DT-51]|uniref:hypothetical protein n=1 Tax=Sphingomonas sp. DT-51 TaxID=3396165 RepID=UPI003F1A4A23
MTQQTEHDDPKQGGTNSPGENGEDHDILGKKQEDLTAKDLEGDSRSEGETSGVADAERKFLGDFA